MYHIATELVSYSMTRNSTVPKGMLLLYLFITPEGMVQDCKNYVGNNILFDLGSLISYLSVGKCFTRNHPIYVLVCVSIACIGGIDLTVSDC